MSGNALAGIEVKTGADPIVRRNRIHDGKSAGIVVYEQGRGTYEDNEVSGNALPGIEVGTGADPVVRRNRIHDGKYDRHPRPRARAGHLRGQRGVRQRLGRDFR